LALFMLLPPPSAVLLLTEPIGLLVDLSWLRFVLPDYAKLLLAYFRTLYCAASIFMFACLLAVTLGT